IQSGLQMQKSVPKKEAVVPPPVTPPPAPVAQTQPPVTNPPAVEIKRAMPYLWIGGGIAGILLLSLVCLLLVRSFREEKHVCPPCGRVLESYQTVCPVCASADTRREPVPVPIDGTQEIKTHIESEEELIPVELLEKKPVTEEMLSRTFV